MPDLVANIGDTVRGLEVALRFVRVNGFLLLVSVFINIQPVFSAQQINHFIVVVAFVPDHVKPSTDVQEFVDNGIQV